MKWIYFIIFAFSALLSFKASVAFGCSLSQDNPWKYDEKTLIDKTPTIIVVKAVQKIKARAMSQDPDNEDSLVDYRFEVVEVVKGKYKKKKFELRRVWPRGDEGIAYWKDCRTTANLKIGSSYLVFVENLNALSFTNMAIRGAELIEKVRASLGHRKLSPGTVKSD